MEATKLGGQDRQVARDKAPWVDPARADRLALDAVRIVLIGVLAMLVLIGVAGVAAELAAIGAPPIDGPIPGYYP